jgi:hypothetical protein
MIARLEDLVQSANPASPSNSQPDKAGDPLGAETISLVTGFVPVEW